MDAKISCCGIDCSSCEQFGTQCKGCNAQKGRMYWTSEIPSGVCPIYYCCRVKKQHDHCGLCKLLPCDIWNMKDPSWTDEEYEAGVRSRIDTLKNL